MINYIQIAREQHEAEEELEVQRRIVLARDTYGGRLPPQLDTELAGALLSQTAEDIQELFNIYAMVVDEVANRLNVIGLQSVAGGQPPAAAVEFWASNGLQEFQGDIHLAALRDGEAFLLLAPETGDDGQVRIRAYPHGRYTSAEAGGDNEGIRFHYADDVMTLNRAPDFASKRWIETFVNEDEESDTRQRMTLYIPARGAEAGRVEKYAMNEDAEWEEYRDEEDTAWPIPWPHPFPVIRFRNVSGRLQGARAQGGQIVIDNLMAALISAASSIAIPPLRVLGGMPTIDGQTPAADGANVWKLGPRQVVGFADKGPADASVDFMRPGDVGQVIAAINEVTKFIAMTTGTPSLMASRLGSLPIAAKLLQQLDLQPVAATIKAQNAFGNAWRQVFSASSGIAAGLGAAAGEPAAVIWAPADVFGQFHDEGAAEPFTDVLAAKNGESGEVSEVEA